MCAFSFDQAPDEIARAHYRIVPADDTSNDTAVQLVLDLRGVIAWVTNASCTKGKKGAARYAPVPDQTDAYAWHPLDDLPHGGAAERNQDGNREACSSADARESRRASQSGPAAQKAADETAKAASAARSKAADVASKAADATRDAAKKGAQVAGQAVDSAKKSIS